MYKKRGQATIVILLGIVIIGLVFGVYFSRDYILKSNLERMSEKTLIVPKQAESFRDYVVSCVKQVSEQAVDLAGQKGGYTEIPGDSIPLGIYNKFSNNLDVLPNLNVPYWYYRMPNGIDKYQILNLDQIGKNIEDYTNEQLRACVGDFALFKKQGYKVNPGLIKTSVEIGNDNIIFGIVFPIHIEIKDFKFDFSEFYYKSEKPLGELYDIARAIFNYENGKYFLEEKTIDAMVSSEQIPMTGESFECSAPIWDKFVITEGLKRILTYNIPSIKIKNTDYLIQNKEREYYEVDVGADNPDLSVNLMYSNRWPFEIEVSPEENGILKGESISSNLGRLRSIVESFVCYNSWHFVYNIKYPVLVIVNKNDYTFQYAMMTVIDRNEPRKSSVTPISIPDVDTRFCDNKQSNIAVSVYDENGNAVNGADISYKCINHLCSLGSTAGNIFTGLVMPCGNGFAIANKDGYNTGMSQVSTMQDSSVSITMKKYQNINVNAEVLRGGSGSLKENEKVYITLTNNLDDYGVTIIYPDIKNVKLIPGDYKVSMYMIKDSSDKITIPEKEVEHCVEIPKKGFTSIFGATETKCVNTKIPSIELDRVITGAADFDISISNAQLSTGKITFFVPYQGIPTQYEDLYKISSTVGENFVYPRFG